MAIDPTQLTLFIPAALALNLTPGNDNMYCLGQGLKSGPLAGVVASLGIATGSLIHTLVAAFGLAALLAAYPLAFEVIRWLGVGYLVWLAFVAFQTPIVGGEGHSSATESLLRIWRDGTLVNLLNPKVAVFVLAFIPQFIDQTRGSTVIQFIIFGTILNVMGTTVAATIGIFSGSIGQQLTRNAFIARSMQWACALIFLGLAAKLALDRS